MQKKQRVVILGAGIVGAAIAYELSLIPDFEVTILDTGLPGTGSTGAALGVLMGIISHKTKGRAWQLRRRSMTRFPGLLEELAIAGHPVPHNPAGVLKLFDGTTDRAKLEALQQKRRDEGWQLEIWDQSQLQAQCPQIQSEICHGAVYSPQDFQVQPVPLTQALLRVAADINAKSPVQCHFGVSPPKLAIAAQNGKQNCVTVTTDQGSFPCDWLVVSAGLGSLDITKSLTADIQMQPVLGQAWHVKIQDSAGSMPRSFVPVVSYNDIHVVPLGNGEFWVGATVEFPDETGTLIADETLMERVWQQAIAFYPELAEAKILRHWSGDRPRPVSQGAPILQPLKGYPNILLATGHYRNGVLLAPGTALQIRDWLVDPGSIPR
jgi:glycine oxidase